MPPELINVTVRIYGWDYTLKVPPEQEERAKSIAVYLDKRMQQVALKSGTADTLKISIRAALTIVDELLEVKEQVKTAAIAKTAAAVVATDKENLTRKLNALESFLDKEISDLE